MGGEAPGAVGVGGASGEAGQGNVAGEAGAAGEQAADCRSCPTTAAQICVYQVGGPGPGRFVCAAQTPCDALTACGCVEGQGVCEPSLMGEPPTYCRCDNGLE